MSENKSNWGGFLRNYFKNTVHTKKPSEQKVSTNFNEFEKTFYKKHEVVAKEPVIPNEEYQEEVKLAQQYLPEVNEHAVEETEIDELPENYKGEQTVDEMLEEMNHAKLLAASQAKRMISSMQKDVTKIINDGYQEKETDLTPEEIAEFARLNGIEDVKATLSEDGKTLEIEGNVKVAPELKEVPVKVAAVEQPTETKVKSVKISKPKDEVKKEKPTKPIKKPVTPKAPKRPRAKK